MASPRDLPSIDALVKDPALAPVVAGYGRETVKQALRNLQASWRARGGAPPWAGDPAAWAGAVDARLGTQGYRPVFNLTGTLVHTNLGRALLHPELLDAVRELVTRPMNLEYDLARGRRGNRDLPVARRLTLLTGAEAATVVNNNAAALVLVLNTLALDRAVPVSRGELVEIGGSFRLPDIMARAGCRLLEVGTTNRTHPADFEASLTAEPGLLLKVHPSNFQQSGFTREVGTGELAAIGRPHGVPVCVDLGSGSLVDLGRWGLPAEPTVSEVLAQGADLVTFSGDKLLGGIQAGLIVGRRDLVEACNSNPLKRALRPDKLTLALLDRLLAAYEEPDTLPDHVPLLRMLTTPPEILEARARRLVEVLAPVLSEFTVDVAASQGQIGSGALPGRTVPSVAVRISHPGGQSLGELAAHLRALPVPVIGRIAQGSLWLDMRGAEPLDELADTLNGLERVR